MNLSGRTDELLDLAVREHKEKGMDVEAGTEFFLGMWPEHARPRLHDVVRSAVVAIHEHGAITAYELLIEKLDNI